MASSRIRVQVVRTWILVLAFAAGAFAQETPAEAPAAATQAIPAAEVAAESDLLMRRLRQARERAATLPDIEGIESALDERKPALATMRDETEASIAGQPTLEKLAEFEREWSLQELELSGWRRDLTGRAATLEGVLDGLREDGTRWAATLEAVSVDGAPSEVVEAVRRSIAAIDETRGLTSKRRSQVLSLQNRASQLEFDVTETIAAIEAARSTLRARLFEPDQSPIWSMIAGDGSPAASRVTAALEEEIETVGAFLEKRSGGLVTLIGLLVLAWAGALGLKRSIAARREAGGDIEDSSRVFERPISIAVLLTLLAVFWVFPLAPESLVDLVGLLLLVPMLRLLPVVMHPGFRPMLYGIAVFYVVDGLRALLEGAPLESRVVFAVECAAAALFCIALMRPSRIAKIPEPDKFPHWPARAIRVGAIGFGAAFVANVVGYGALSTLVGGGLLQTIYIAIGVYAGVRVSGIILDVSTKTAWAQRVHVLRARRAVVVGWMRRAISILAFGLWLYWSLGVFSVRDAVLGTLERVLTQPLEVGSASVSLGNVLAFGLTIGASIVLARVIRFVLMEDVFSRVRVARGVPYAVSATAHYAILFAGFLLAVAAAGIDFSKFTLLAGAFGVGIGFGLQNVVNNFVSGIILLFERPVQVGDAIDLGDLVGKVKRIGIRSSTIRTFNGSEVIVPNGDLISQRVVNWTLSDKTLRVDVPIGVAYGTDPDVVLELLSTIASEHEKILNYPAPVPLFRGHGDSSLDFELRFWISDFDDRFSIESSIHRAINHGLRDAGIEIPFPQRDLHVRSVDADALRRVQGEEEA